MFLGVDGGGTKTAYAIVDAEGRLRASQVGAAIAHLADGLDAARARLAEGLKAVFATAAATSRDVAYAFVGLPAYGEDGGMTAALDALPAAILARDRYRCGNDMVCSWAGSLACADGISVIAGTGSMAYGEYAGRQARCGGWGELIGDEGSAYWIAREGMNLFSRMSDGRAARGPLHRLVREHFGLENDLYLCSRIYGARADRRDAFAQFARLVHEAAQAGDAEAAAIFARGARELIDCVVATHHALGASKDQAVPVSHSGGVFDNAPAMVNEFRAGLAAAPVRLEYRAPQFPPAAGAALYAARLAGTPLSDAALGKLQQQLQMPGVTR
ncbi:MAG TPA: BadF/BadG/BcrA/BcrD ATPase family protein [Steroidobacteraceae bacterium]|nr:BadF/BadG/BcrA/BcrD ATPase family protein [Steroidobacteraceae bacterium]